jgi:hypothetical protein
MKKLLSISFALIILLSGMNLTIATHYCGGQIAATKISFVGKTASCGMESHKKSNLFSGTNLAKHCCDNVISSYSVDHNYTPSKIVIIEILLPVLQVFDIPVNAAFDFHCKSTTCFTQISPPGNFTYNAVNMAYICAFRI